MEVKKRTNEFATLSNEVHIQLWEEVVYNYLVTTVTFQLSTVVDQRVELLSMNARVTHVQKTVKVRLLRPGLVLSGRPSG